MTEPTSGDTKPRPKPGFDFIPKLKDKKVMTGCSGKTCLDAMVRSKLHGEGTSAGPKKGFGARF